MAKINANFSGALEVISGVGDDNQPYSICMGDIEIVMSEAEAIELVKQLRHELWLCEAPECGEERVQ